MQKKKNPFIKLLLHQTIDLEDRIRIYQSIIHKTKQTLIILHKFIKLIKQSKTHKTQKNSQKHIKLRVLCFTLLMHQSLHYP